MNNSKHKYWQVVELGLKLLFAYLASTHLSITRCKYVVSGLLCLVMLSACQPQTSQDDGLAQVRAERAADFEPCQRNSTTQAAALVASSRCLIFMVAENPDEPEGRQIPLQVLLLPALNTEASDDPVVVLAGGPGQAATTLVQLAQIFRQVRQDRDIIFMDQRGTGELSPLQCDFEETEENNLSLDEILALQLVLIRACLSNMEARPEFYSTDIAIKDLEALRQYLGYRQLNLWGGSYGTRVALAYLQAYPEFTRTLVIDGVAPPAISLPLYMERDASTALSLILADCAEQPSCNNAYPDLARHFEEVVEKLTNQATPQIILSRDALDNSESELTFNRDMFMALLRAPLYGRETQRLVPFMIEQAYEGNFAPLIAAAGSADAGINQAMYLSVVCNEDLSLFSTEALINERNNDYIINSEIFSVPTIEACKLWPQREIPATYFEPVVSDRPVLIFSGALDPVTPSVWGEQVHATLNNSQHIIVPGFAHSTFNSACTINMLNDFIEAANFSDLEFDCLEQIKRRPFFINAGGAAGND